MDISNADLNTVLAIASTVLAVLAIWMSWQFYKESKVSERNAESALSEIKNQTKTLSTLSMRMLDRLTRYITSSDRGIDKAVSDLVSGLSNKDTQNDSAKKDVINQWRIDNAIGQLYYCLLANVLSRAQLPPTLLEASENEGIKNIVNMTKTDYQYSKRIIDVALSENPTVVSASPNANLYQIALDNEAELLNIEEHYTAIDKSNKQM